MSRLSHSRSRTLSWSMIPFILLFPLMHLAARDVIISELNEIREEYGIPGLKFDEASGTAASIHARDLSERLTLSHWGADGSRVADRYRLAGGTGLRAGENLGAGDSIKSIIEAWMDSPAHRKNIINPDWFSGGASVVHSPGGRLVIVVVFNNSRWRQRGFRINGNRVLVDGDLSLSPGMFPQAVFLKTADKEINSLTAVINDQNSVSLHFDFPIPDKWQSGEVVAMEMNLFENGKLVKTDLILQDVP